MIKSYLYKALFISILLFGLVACQGDNDESSNTTSPTAKIGSATLSWTPPLQNTDGSALTNLKGYRIYYGTSPDLMSESIPIMDLGITEFMVSNLRADKTYYFAITSINADDVESHLSDVVSKLIVG